MNVNMRPYPGVFEMDSDNFYNELNAFLDRVLATKVKKNDNQSPLSSTQTANAYFFEVKLPGAIKKNVEVHFEGENLTIQSGPHEAKDGTEKKAGLLFSTSIGKVANFVKPKKAPFKKTYRLPKDAEPRLISASFRNGVLLLEISRKAI